MSGWKSTKDGKHFRTRDKPGINSGSNSHHNNSGTQSSSVIQNPNPLPGQLPIRNVSWNSKSYRAYLESITQTAKDYAQRDSPLLDNERFYYRSDGNVEGNVEDYSDDFPEAKIVEGEQFDKATILTDKDWLDWNDQVISEQVEFLLQADSDEHKYNVREMMDNSKNKIHEYVFNTTNDFEIKVKGNSAMDASSKAMGVYGRLAAQDKVAIGKINGRFNVSVDGEYPVGDFPFHTSEMPD